MRVITKVIIAGIVLTLLGGTNAVAQERVEQERVFPRTGIHGKDLLDRLTLSGYGTVNYQNYLTKERDPYLKDRLDQERFALYLKLRLTDRIRMSSEIEFEHGGTGATMEFDALEEAGEYEMEIEQGGEVKLEHLYLDFLTHEMANLRVGRFKLHMGLASSLDRPNKYFTVLRPEGEDAMIPLGWYETGVMLFGGFFHNRLTYELAVSSGLDSSGFSSRNWVKRGYQTRFEMPVAEALAYSLRMDYHFGHLGESFVGFSAYAGNTNPNRPRYDMENVKGWLKVAGAHLAVNEGNWRFHSSLLWGDLQNSDNISFKNAHLSKHLNAKRTAVGKQALSVSAELGYNVLPLINRETKQRLYPFVRYDYYDTMFRTSGDVIKLDMWSRSVITAGLNWMITPGLVVKAQYTDRTYGDNYIDPVSKQDMGRKTKERELLVGLGFSF